MTFAARGIRMGRNSGKAPIADALFDSYPARLQIFNQRGISRLIRCRYSGLRK
jgi:hypothetical protein